MNSNHREATCHCGPLVAIMLVTIALAVGCTSDEVVGRREDAPAIVRSSLGTVSWARGFGGSQDDRGMTVALDREGNVVVGGYYVGELALDDTVLANEADYSGFVAKLDGESGAVRWALGNELPEVLDLAVASDGGVAVTGVHYQAFQLGTLEAPDVGEPAIWLAKLDAEGHPLWLKSFGAGSAGGSHFVEVSPTGDVIVSGSFATAIDFGLGPLVPFDVPYDIYLAAFSPSGDLRFGRNLVGDGVHGLAVTNVGQILLAGEYASSFIIDGHDFSATSLANAFLAGFTTSGELSFARAFGGTADSWGVLMTALTAKADGGLIAAGRFLGTTDLGTSGRFYTYFTMSMTPDGALEALTTIPLGSGETWDLATHAGGTVLGGLVTALEVDFGYGPTPGGMFLAEYDHDGSVTAATTYGGFTAFGSHGLTAVAALPDGQLATTGRFYETIDVAGQTLTSHGGADVVVFKLACDLVPPLE